MTFDEWWDKDIDDSENPYRKDSPIYWAYAGWQARGGEVEHWKELAAYRLALLTKMPEDNPWIGLTDDEIRSAFHPLHDTGLQFARAIEAKLKEKNSG